MTSYESFHDENGVLENELFYLCHSSFCKSNFFQSVQWDVDLPAASSKLSFVCIKRIRNFSFYVENEERPEMVHQDDQVDFWGLQQRCDL